MDAMALLEAAQRGAARKEPVASVGKLEATGTMDRSSFEAEGSLFDAFQKHRERAEQQPPPASTSGAQEPKIRTSSQKSNGVQKQRSNSNRRESESTQTFDERSRELDPLSRMLMRQNQQVNRQSSELETIISPPAGRVKHEKMLHYSA